MRSLKTSCRGRLHVLAKLVAGSLLLALPVPLAGCASRAVSAVDELARILQVRADELEPVINQAARRQGREADEFAESLAGKLRSASDDVSVGTRELAADNCRLLKEQLAWADEWESRPAGQSTLDWTLEQLLQNAAAEYQAAPMALRDEAEEAYNQLVQLRERYLQGLDISPQLWALMLQSCAALSG